MDSKFKDCVDKLEYCVKEIKNLTRQLDDLHDGMLIKDAILKVEEGVEVIEHIIDPLQWDTR